jgi:hypothetical protein
MSDSSIIQAGRDTIAREIEGLHAVSDALDAQFVRVVRLVAGLKGRLIVSGMGKSGHIARNARFYGYACNVCASCGSVAWRPWDDYYG